MTAVLPVRPGAAGVLGRVVVVGGALMDVLAHSRQPLLPRTSNPGRVHTTPGGVGRNIAENLARLGTPVGLVAVVGPDAFGDRIVEEAASVGIDTREMISTSEPTGTYLAVLDHDGEMAVALSDLAATESLTPGRLAAAEPAIAGADLLVIDGNIPAPVVGRLLDVAAGHGIRVVIDPVSVAKAQRLASALRPDRPVFAITPNADELAVLAAAISHPHARPCTAGSPVQWLWVRRGPGGSTLYAADGAALELAAPPTHVVDVTGAGDAATAGFVHALLGGADPADAAAYGQVCAALTVASPHTVRPDLTDAFVRQHLEDAP